jgi:hypothetical protein
MNGEITFESKENEGMEVVISLKKGAAADE